MDKKINLTGKEWWLHLMYWDPDKVEVVNFCDIWRIPFMATFKAFVLCMSAVLYVLVHLLCACLFWSRPNLGTVDQYFSLPFDRVFGVRWGNFLLPLYVIIIGSFGVFTNTGGWRMTVGICALTLLGFTIVFLIIDDFFRLSQFSTLQSGSLIECLCRKGQLVWRGVTAAFKKKKTETGTKPKDESVGLFKVLRLRFKSFREKVCYSIPIVRD